MERKNKIAAQKGGKKRVFHYYFFVPFDLQVFGVENCEIQIKNLLYCNFHQIPRFMIRLYFDLVNFQFA